MESSSAAVACAFASFSGPQRAMSAAPTKVTSWVCAMTWLLKKQTWSTGTQNNTMTSPLVNNIVTSEGNCWSEYFLNMLSCPENLILEGCTKSESLLPRTCQAHRLRTSVGVIRDAD